eukprot:Skav212199  [mRNA]  locus=scaffold754:649263:659207:+ [translate_table: standard]
MTSDHDLGSAPSSPKGGGSKQIQPVMASKGARQSDSKPGSRLLQRKSSKELLDEEDLHAILALLKVMATVKPPAASGRRRPCLGALEPR